MDEFMKGFAPHFVSFVAGGVLAGIAGHFAGIGGMVITAYLVGAYGSKHIRDFIFKKLS